MESLESLFGRSADVVEANGMRNPYFIRRVNVPKPVFREQGLARDSRETRIEQV